MINTVNDLNPIYLEPTNNIIIYGAGAIGCTLAAWLSPYHENTFLLCRGESAKRIWEKGIKIYSPEAPESYVPVKVIESIDEVKNPAVIALTVKNYSLPEIVKNLEGKLSSNTIVLGLQNGTINQTLFAPLYGKVPVLFGVLAYNAWLDEPGVVGYQHKGVMVIGSGPGGVSNPFGALQSVPSNAEGDLNHSGVGLTPSDVAAIFNKGLETFVANNWQNVAHTKLLINMGNSITTLLGKNFSSTARPELMLKITGTMMLEGMRILKAAGFKEERIKGLPSWTLLKASALLPQFITAPMFRKNIKKMGMSSMAQDIFNRHGQDTELEDINGYMLSLADRHGIAAPYNRVVYRLCKQKFAEPGFEGMRVEDVWEEIVRSKES